MKDGFIVGGSGSSPLNFKVVGGLSEPLMPRENMVWVNTAEEINTYVFAPKVPENPLDGQVWLQTTTDGGVQFNILKKNGIITNVVNVKQYINASWVYVAASVYQGGVWRDLDSWLYYKGDLCEGLTGGWDNFGICLSSEYKDPLALTISYNADSVTLKSSRASGQPLGRWSPKNKINLSGFSKVVVNVLSASSSGGPLELSVVSTHGTYYTDYRVAALDLLGKSGKATLDISKVDSECYVCLDVYRSKSITINEIKLVP